MIQQYINMKKIPKFDLKDVAITPTIVSHIVSRSECETKYESGYLPLMAAPMDTVVCSDNAKTFKSNHIIPCMPRGTTNEDVIGYHSYGLSEIEDYLHAKESTKQTDFYKYKYILIDIANGHMQRLIDVVKQLKKKFPNKILMVGNIAHPLTYKNLAMAGADLVRCSIGTGAGCTTATNVAINYPMGSLILECYVEKTKGNFKTKIVADGGMQGYDDIIKALALGADYVMIGSLFNKTLQSAGFNYLWKIKLGYNVASKLWKWGFPVKKKYRGMSTKAVQRSWGRTKLVTAEGITKYQKIQYNLSQWTENFEDYLKSNMSYCGTKTLKEFIGKVEWEYITNNSFLRFNK